MPGSASPTIGRRLAKALSRPMLDTDATIEETTGRTIADIFATDGEAEFRRIEAEVVRSALAEHDGVVSSVAARSPPRVRAALAGHTVVYLEISAAEGIRRTGGSSVRPLLAGPDRAEKFRALMSERVPLYRQVATMRINTNRRNPGAVVRTIVTRLDNPRVRNSPSRLNSRGRASGADVARRGGAVRHPEPPRARRPKPVAATTTRYPIHRRTHPAALAASSRGAQ